jgi:DNA-binding Xre family transcriptional regulator
MMKVKIREIAERQGIKNAKQLAKLTGLSVTSCYQLWNETAKAISFESLNTLCNVLQAGPAVLLDYTPDVEPLTESGPLQNEIAPRRSSAKGSHPKPKRQARTAAVAIV